MSYQPTISIIIAVKNAAMLLKETLESIRQQQYPALEAIVIDGGSVDDTVSIIQNYQDIISYYCSEPDQGISDAFNKGLKKATGEYINFQGAGDVLFSQDCIKQLFADLDSSYKLICGQILRVKEDGQTALWVAPKKIAPFNSRSLLFKMTLPHQGLFTHRSFFEQVGEFDTSVHFAMDYELLLRAYHHFPKTIVKKVIISRWRAGGISSHHIEETLDEYHRLKIQHQVAPNWTLKLIDRFNRSKYWLKGKLKIRNKY